LVRFNERPIGTIAFDENTINGGGKVGLVFLKTSILSSASAQFQISGLGEFPSYEKYFFKVK